MSSDSVLKIKENQISPVTEMFFDWMIVRISCRRVSLFLFVVFILFFLFWFSSSGFLPFDVSNIFSFLIFEKKKIKLFLALVGAA